MNLLFDGVPLNVDVAMNTVWVLRLGQNGIRENEIFIIVI